MASGAIDDAGVEQPCPRCGQPWRVKAGIPVLADASTGASGWVCGPCARSFVVTSEPAAPGEVEVEGDNGDGGLKSEPAVQTTPV